MRPFLAIVTLVAAALGCGGDEPECRFGAECASGACGADGQCLPTSDGGGDADADGDADLDGGAGLDASAGEDGGGEDDGGGPIACSADHDGTITRDEVPLAAGLRATFRIATDATVDTAGRVDGDGVRHWDLATELDGDHSALIETLALEGHWFAGDFPGASYVSRLSDTEDLLGIFEITDDALLLRGVASPEDGLTRTELTYDPPVVVLSFPIEPGDRWSTEADASGVAMGVWAIATERYDSEADARGILSTPFGEFSVQRVHVTLERTVGVFTTTVQTHLFVAECFGTVASVRSRDDESAIDFTEAAEVRRLAP